MPSDVEMHSDAQPGVSSADRRGATSKVVLPGCWFVVSTSAELGTQPRRTRLFDEPVVLFRDASGRAAALIDCCPHRNVPLSDGCVVEGTLQCPYHGWRFDSGGRCVKIPGRKSAPDAIAQNAYSLATIESQGYVWAYNEPLRGGTVAEPTSSPHRFRHLGERGYSDVRFSMRVEGSLYAALENALDVPHTAFLHGGLFRNESRDLDIKVRIRRTPELAEAEYLGEPRPTGLAARLLTPSGGTVTHVDRFVLPSIAQIEYRIGDENHVLIESAMTPLDEFTTQIYTVISFRLRIPHIVGRPLLRTMARRILEQDADILEAQTKTIREFGGEQYASTEIDVLGRHILRLMRSVERGEPLTDEQTTELTLVV